MLGMIRRLLGSIIVGLNWLFRPKRVQRTVERQVEVDAQLNELALYQFHGCPFCVKVRREMYRLRLNIECRDAKHNDVHRQALLEGGGRVKVPCLRIQSSDGVQWMYESSDIVAYLQQRFQ